MLAARRVIIMLEAIVGVLAVAGGAALVARPKGSVLGFDIDLLHGVFDSYLIPGAILVAMGALQFLAAWMTHRRHMWDHLASAAAGAALTLWIAVQVVIIGLHDWTQPVFFLVGSVIYYLATELWRLGEGPHMGMVEGYEGLRIENTQLVAPAWRRSDRWRFLQLIARRGDGGT